jgi:hypothetical protein
LFQLLIRFDVIAQAQPAFGGAEVHQVTRFKRIHNNLPMEYSVPIRLLAKLAPPEVSLPRRDQPNRARIGPFVNQPDRHGIFQSRPTVKLTSGKCFSSITLCEMEYRCNASLYSRGGERNKRSAVAWVFIGQTFAHSRREAARRLGIPIQRLWQMMPQDSQSTANPAKRYLDGAWRREEDNPSAVAGGRLICFSA